MRSLPFTGVPRHLIALDFDGTLWDAQHGISAAFFELMQVLRSQGYLWGINTGRELDYLLLDYQSCPAASFAPDFTITCERYINIAPFGKGLEPLEQWNAKCRRDHEQLFHKHEHEIEHVFAQLRVLYPDIRWERSPEDPYSFEVEHEANLHLLAPHIEDLLMKYSELSAQRAGVYMRFSHADYHKGSALEKLRQYWNIAPQNVIIIGDSYNDFDAMKTHPQALCACPANAEAPIREYLAQHGGYLSPYMSHQGVMDALQHFTGGLYGDSTS